MDPHSYRLCPHKENECNHDKSRYKYLLVGIEFCKSKFIGHNFIDLFYIIKDKDFITENISRSFKVRQI